MFNQLLDFLLSNPILLIILLGWAASVAGNVMTRAARKAQEEQAAARRRERGRVDAAPRVPEARPRPQPTVEASPPVRSPDDVAEEIRRMMGLESAPQVQYELVEESVAPAGVAVQPAEPRHGGDLASELAEKEEVRRLRFDARIDKRRDELQARSDELDQKGSENRQSHLPEHRSRLEQLGGEPRRRPSRRRNRLFDASDPVRAVVALEVLGPPRAARPWE